MPRCRLWRLGWPPCPPCGGHPDKTPAGPDPVGGAAAGQTADQPAALVPRPWGVRCGRSPRPIIATISDQGRPSLAAPTRLPLWVYGSVPPDWWAGGTGRPTSLAPASALIDPVRGGRTANRRKSVRTTMEEARAQQPQRQLRRVGSVDRRRICGRNAGQQARHRWAPDHGPPRPGRATRRRPLVTPRLPGGPSTPGPARHRCTPQSCPPRQCRPVCPPGAGRRCFWVVPRSGGQSFGINWLI